MAYYVFIKNEKINGNGEVKCLNKDILNIEVDYDVYKNIERYEYKNGEIVEIENYEELQAKKERKQEILEELNALDLKSIRALRANETERLQELEKQAIGLRKRT